MTAALAISPSSGASSPESGNDHGRLREAFDANFDFVWRFLRRLGVPELTVDDAAQEVFLVLSRRLPTVERGAERSFLFATALRVASTSRRADTRRGVRDDVGLAELVDGAPRPDQIIEQRRRRGILAEVLDTLDVDLRTVFVLYELEEMTMAEIATMLELAPGTVASRLRRAREAFQDAATRFRGGR